MLFFNFIDYFIIREYGYFSLNNFINETNFDSIT